MLPSHQRNHKPGHPMLYSRSSPLCICCDKKYDKKGNKASSLVMTKNRALGLHKKAKDLNDRAMLAKISDISDTPIDMVAQDVCYHQSCMNRYMSQRVKESKQKPKISSRRHGAKKRKTPRARGKRKKVLKHVDAMKYVTKLLKKDMLRAKQNAGERMEFTREFASQIVPQSLLEFSHYLTSTSSRNEFDESKVSDKAVDLSQQIMFAVRRGRYSSGK